MAGGQSAPLVVSFGALGDSILLTAILDSLAAAWCRPCDLLLKKGPGVELLAAQPTVGGLRALTSRRRPSWLSRERREVVRWLRGRRSGPVYFVDEIAERPVAELLAQGRIGEQWVVSYRTVPRGDLEHKIDHFHRLARAGAPAFPASLPGGEPPPCLPSLTVPPEQVAECGAWLRARGWEGEPLVLFQTRSRNRQRGRWGDDRWASLLREVLARDSGRRGVLLGSAAERPEVAGLGERLPGVPVWNLAGELPLPRLLALLALAHSCVSLDSGPAHAAAAVGCPLVVVLGKADPRRNAPRSSGSPVRLVSAWPETDWPSSRREWEATHRMEQVRVEDVVAAWQSVSALRGQG
ncbi:MAG TPA: glycosyltransferase family 9 protein [Thermoanaerobaculia bacterium]|nr:glycosyltransferase family 9 protein [Thermoanaerobaculia bacterium]